MGATWHMDRFDVQLIVECAQLSDVPQRMVPAATVVLHECMSLRDVPCALEFHRLVRVERLISPGLEFCPVSNAHTIAGIRLDGTLFNARGRDPWLDATQSSSSPRHYLSWAKEEDVGLLGLGFLQKARHLWGNAIQSAVDRIVLDAGTVDSRDKVVISRL